MNLSLLLLFPPGGIDFTLSVQMRMGLIQQLEAAHLVPVAAPSCDVMMLLRPAASGSSFAPSREGGPAGLVNAPAPEERVWESISCVVSS